MSPAEKYTVANIGNTAISFGLFSSSKLLKVSKIPVDQISRARHILSKNGSDILIYCSVCPSREKILKKIASSVGMRVLKFGEDIKPQIKFAVPYPWKVGADRVANSVASYHRCKGVCVVIDIGTAITFDVVSKGGYFEGGLIAPGPMTSARALHNYCELLPIVEPQACRKRFGKTTEENIALGIHYSICGIIEVGLRAIKKQIGNFKVVGTGGYAKSYRRYFDVYDPYLTLRGVAISYLKSGFEFL